MKTTEYGEPIIEILSVDEILDRGDFGRFEYERADVTYPFVEIGRDKLTYRLSPGRGKVELSDLGERLSHVGYRGDYWMPLLIHPLTLQEMRQDFLDIAHIILEEKFIHEITWIITILPEEDFKFIYLYIETDQRLTAVPDEYMAKLNAELESLRQEIEKHD